MKNASVRYYCVLFVFLWRVRALRSEISDFYVHYFPLYMWRGKLNSEILTLLHNDTLLQLTKENQI